MAGMAAAEAAPWLVVRLRGVLCAVDAHSSGAGHTPAWRLTIALTLTLTLTIALTLTLTLTLTLILTLSLIHISEPTRPY